MPWTETIMDQIYSKLKEKKNHISLVGINIICTLIVHKMYWNGSMYNIIFIIHYYLKRVCARKNIKGSIHAQLTTQSSICTVKTIQTIQSKCCSLHFLVKHMQACEYWHLIGDVNKSFF